MKNKAEKQKKNKNALRAFYAAASFFVILATVTLAILHLSGTINLEEAPLYWVNLGLHIALWTDYLVRFVLAKNKGEHFKRSFDELIAILPFSEVLTLLHIFRLLHMLGMIKLLSRALEKPFRKFADNVRELMNTNGFCYVLCIALVLILTSAFLACKMMNTPYWETLVLLMSGALHGKILLETLTALYIILCTILAASLSSTITCFSLKKSRSQIEKPEKEEITNQEKEQIEEKNP